MPFPPVIPPATRSNTTPQLDSHPSDHNAISNAFADIVKQLTPIAWVEAAAAVAITATSIAASQLVVSSGAITYDGSPIIIEYSAPLAQPPAGALAIMLYDGATEMGYFSYLSSTVTGFGFPVNIRRRLTPAAGSHTFLVRAWVSAGQGNLVAGNGVAGAHSPMILSVRRAS
jgi:hypothetical protein